jgi:hypothetical protein
MRNTGGQRIAVVVVAVRSAVKPADMQKTTICDFWLKGKECPHPSCFFAHGGDEFTDGRGYKLKECFYYVNGNCGRGDKCRDIHNRDQDKGYLREKKNRETAQARAVNDQQQRERKLQEQAEKKNLLLQQEIARQRLRTQRLQNCKATRRQELEKLAQQKVDEEEKARTKEEKDRSDLQTALKPINAWRIAQEEERGLPLFCNMLAGRGKGGGCVEKSTYGQMDIVHRLWLKLWSNQPDDVVLQYQSQADKTGEKKKKKKKKKKIGPEGMSKLWEELREAELACVGLQPSSPPVHSSQMRYRHYYSKLLESRQKKVDGLSMPEVKRSTTDDDAYAELRQEDLHKEEGKVEEEEEVEEEGNGEDNSEEEDVNPRTYGQQILQTILHKLRSSANVSASMRTLIQQDPGLLEPSENCWSQVFQDLHQAFEDLRRGVFSVEELNEKFMMELKQVNWFESVYIGLHSLYSMHTPI